MDITADYFLSMLIKRSILGSDDIRDYESHSRALSDVGFPACGVKGVRSSRACGGATCPHCEFARRLRFARAVVTATRDTELSPSLALVRVLAPRLSDLVDAYPPALRKRVSRVEALIGWRVSVGYSRQLKSWVFDRVIVAATPLSGLGPDVVVTTAEECEQSTEPSARQLFGDRCGFISAVVTTGVSPLSAGDADDSGVDAEQVWRESNRRHKLMHVVHEKK